MNLNFIILLRVSLLGLALGLLIGCRSSDLARDIQSRQASPATYHRAKTGQHDPAANLSQVLEDWTHTINVWEKESTNFSALDKRMLDALRTRPGNYRLPPAKSVSGDEFLQRIKLLPLALAYECRSHIQWRLNRREQALADLEQSLYLRSQVTRTNTFEFHTARFALSLAKDDLAEAVESFKHIVEMPGTLVDRLKQRRDQEEQRLERANLHAHLRESGPGQVHPSDRALHKNPQAVEKIAAAAFFLGSEEDLCLYGDIRTDILWEKIDKRLPKSDFAKIKQAPVCAPYAVAWGDDAVFPMVEMARREGRSEERLRAFRDVKNSEATETQTTFECGYVRQSVYETFRLFYRVFNESNYNLITTVLVEGLAALACEIKLAPYWQEQGRRFFEIDGGVIYYEAYDAYDNAKAVKFLKKPTPLAGSNLSGADYDRYVARYCEKRVLPAIGQCRWQPARAAAIDALGTIFANSGNQELQTRILQAGINADFDARAAAIRSAARIGPQKSLAAFITSHQLLDDPSWVVRMEASRALGGMEATQYAPYLRIRLILEYAAPVIDALKLAVTPSELKK